MSWNFCAAPTLIQSLQRLAILALLGMLGACSPRMIILQNVADELASQGRSDEDDLLLARDASAFYLKLSESVLRQSPGHLKLAEAVSGGFTQYAFAFVAFEADRIESRDARAAAKLRQRAARLYRRAHRHAMAALEHHHPGFAKALASSSAAAWPHLRDAEIGVAYWAAASWGGLISLSKDEPDVVADLPSAIRLAHLAWQQQPDHGDGGLSSLMGTFEAARPGGSPALAAVYFDRAIRLSAGASAGPYVGKAESIALAAGDRIQFETLLRQALEAGSDRHDLQNEVMRERAQWLLDSADDLF
jgi:hypothetical protein